MCTRIGRESARTAGVLNGAAYTTFRRAASESGGERQPRTATVVGPNANFVLTAMSETSDIVAAALGDERDARSAPTERR